MLFSQRDEQSTSLRFHQALGKLVSGTGAILVERKLRASQHPTWARLTPFHTL